MSRCIFLGLLLISAPAFAENWEGKEVIVIQEDADVNLPDHAPRKLQFAERFRVKKDQGDTLEVSRAHFKGL